MNNKAQSTLGLAIIVAIMIFMVGFMSVNFIKMEVTRARGATNLDCADTTGISDGTKLTCLVVDWVVPYFIILIFAIGGGIVTARFVTGTTARLAT